VSAPRPFQPAGALPHGRVVLGVGIDLCEVPRIARAVGRHGERFLDRLFREGEIRRPLSSPVFAEHVAGLFAAKEAAMKALGTGMRGVAFREISIERRPGGPPLLALHGRAAERGELLGAAAAHVTITHTKELAAAVVLLLGPGPPTP
jgi:holo-[acyl-carrier protein] synthase